MSADRQKAIVYGLIAAAFATFFLSLLWFMRLEPLRSQPNPLLGQVIATTDHGRTYYLTRGEDAWAEWYSGGSVFILLCGIYLGQRWDLKVFKRRAT